MTHRLKSKHKKNSELQKFKTKVKNILDNRRILFFKDTNETIGKLKLSDKEKELLRQEKELEK